MNKRILILYTSIGLGHKYIAINIGYYLEQAGYEVKYHDVLKLQSGIMVSVGEWFHSLINRRFPFVWRWLYLSKIFSASTRWLRVPLAGSNCENVKQVIQEFHPDMVIATQTSASAPMAYLKRHGLYKGKFVIAFSDYHFHPYWEYKEADLYLTNIEEQKNALVKLGTDPKKISQIGITLKPQEQVDAQAVKQKLGLTGKSIYLMSSGSLGIGFPESLLIQFAEELTQTKQNVQLVVVCGKNEKMKERLSGIVEQNKLNMTVLGFYEPMEELYSITEVFLTKPGGLTTAEALRDNVKLLTTHFLPGQEELNYKFLSLRGLIHPIPNPMTAENLVKVAAELESKKIEVENSNSIEITQKNSEGKALIKSIENLFHGV